MINNLLTEIRDGKGKQFAHGLLTDVSKNENEQSKTLFGQLFQSLQEDEQNDEGDNISFISEDNLSEDYSPEKKQAGNKREIGKKDVPGQYLLNKITDDSAGNKHQELKLAVALQQESESENLPLEDFDGKDGSGKDDKILQFTESENIETIHENIEKIISAGDGNGETAGDGNNETAGDNDTQTVLDNANESAGENSVAEFSHSSEVGSSQNGLVPPEMEELRNDSELTSPVQGETKSPDTKSEQSLSEMDTTSDSGHKIQKRIGSEAQPAGGKSDSKSDVKVDHSSLRAENPVFDKTVDGSQKNMNSPAAENTENTPVSKEVRTEETGAAEANKKAETAVKGEEESGRKIPEVKKTDGLAEKITAVGSSKEHPHQTGEPSDSEKVKIVKESKNILDGRLRPQFLKQQEDSGVRQIRIENVRERASSDFSFQQKPNSVTVPETTGKDAREQQQKLNNILLNFEKVITPTEKGAEFSSINIEQFHGKRYKTRVSSFENRGENSTKRGNIGSERRISPLPSDNVKVFSRDEFQASLTTSTEEVRSNDQELPWKEYKPDFVEIKENDSTEQQRLGFSRLVQIPVSNVSIRRNLIPGLTQAILKTTSASNYASEKWQKHNFALENGKTIQLSVRQADGILYLKLNSSHGELSRLLQQHQNEIREHLERESDIEIDLQFEDDQGMSQFFGDSSSPNHGRKNRSSLSSSRDDSQSATNRQDVQKSIRKFGYNRMEWTA